MNTTMFRALSFSFVLLAAATVVHAAEHPAAANHAASAAPTAAPAASSPTDSSAAAASAAAASAAASAVQPGADDDFAESSTSGHARKRHHSKGSGNDIVSIGHNSHLAAGEKADSVVSVFGSSTSDGDAGEVVSVLGNTRVTGTVHGDAVAVLGNLYVDGKVEGDAVAVAGSVQLGPHAEVDGDVNAVLGGVHRTSESIIHGDVSDVFLGDISDVEWLQQWVHECLFEGRPLALTSGIGWAWTLALLLLALYVFLALLFPRGVRACVTTLDTRPGPTALAALLAALFTPVLLVLLFITVIGIAAVPAVLLTLLSLSLFGKAVVLAWMGHRVLGQRSEGSHPALAVLIGGAIALVLYVIPVVGFLSYKLLGFFGFGAVVYTVLLGQRARQASKAEQVNGGPYSTAAGGAAGAAQAGAAQAGAAQAGGAPAAGDPAATFQAADASVAAAVASAGSTEFAPAGASSGPGASQASASQAGAVPPGATPPGAQRADFSPQVLATLPRAGFWLRMGALLIDVLLVGFLSSFALGSVHHGSNLHLLVLATYGACMWKLRGSTVGGIVCDLRVVRADGRAVEWETAIVRALSCFLSLAVCGLGFIWIAFDANHQAWHDKIAGTLVVRVPKGRPLV